MNVDVTRLIRALGITAKRQGRELWAQCPYPGHERDSKPSWSIADGGERNGLNYCFGCGAAGGALELVLEVVGLSGYAAARSWIKERGLDADDPDLPSIKLVVKRFDSKSKRIEEPRGLLKTSISTWPTPARKYILARGIDEHQRARWGIACAVDGELAGRLWIPVCNAAGELVDWTARSWCGDELRYKNLAGGGIPGSIFGEIGWPRISRRTTENLVICEGAFDALACERAGALYVGGLGGVTKYDRWMAMKIAGWGSVTIAVDPDGAGDRVAELIALLGRLPGIRRLWRIDLPPGVDCNKLWKTNPAGLIEQLGTVKC
jgi:DNA primase